MQVELVSQQIRAAFSKPREMSTLCARLRNHLDPDSPVPATRAAQHNLRGILAHLMGHLEDAEHDFAQALACCPKWASPLYNLALVAAAGHNHALASERFREAMGKAASQKLLAGLARHGAALHGLLASRKAGGGLVQTSQDTVADGTPMRLNICSRGKSEPVWTAALDLARARILGVPRPGAECSYGDLVAYELYFPHAVQDFCADGFIGSGAPRSICLLEPAGFQNFEVFGPAMPPTGVADVMADLRAAGFPAFDPWSCMSDSSLHSPTGLLAGGIAIQLKEDPEKQAGAALDALARVGRRRGIQLCAPGLAKQSGDELAAARHRRTARQLGHHP